MTMPNDSGQGSGVQLKWIVQNGEPVHVGDYVAVDHDLDTDCVGRIIDVTGDHTGRPLVLLTEGRNQGKKVSVWPTQLLLKVRR